MIDPKDYIMEKDLQEKKKKRDDIVKARNKAHALIKDAEARYIKDKTRAKSKKAAMEKDAALRSARFKALEEYDRKQDIIDAYGWNMITENKCDKLLELWDEREELKKKQTEDGFYSDEVTEILGKAMFCVLSFKENEIAEYEEMERKFRQQMKEIEEQRFQDHEDYKAWKNGWGKYAPKKED